MNVPSSDSCWVHKSNISLLRAVTLVVTVLAHGDIHMYILCDTNSDKEWPTFFTDAEDLTCDIKEITFRSKLIFGENYTPNLVLMYRPK